MDDDVGIWDDEPQPVDDLDWVGFGLIDDDDYPEEDGDDAAVVDDSELASLEERMADARTHSPPVGTPTPADA